MNSTITQDEHDAIIQSLRAGVVPRIGLEHIQVGRKDEVSAFLKDLERIENGSSSFRFVIGHYGSGKSFFLSLARILAMAKKFVVVQADVSNDRRLSGSNGQARALYAELISSMAIRTKPNGGALSSIVERWVSDIDFGVRQTGGSEKDVEAKIYALLKPLQDYVNGYDFAQAIIKYLTGFHTQNQALTDASIRWLKAEYRTRTEASQELGVRSIIDDSNIYDYLKLIGAFCRMAGYTGLLVNIDEMRVISHRLNSSTARNQNFEMILTVLNDCLQGNVKWIGFLMAGTDEFLEDRHRGLYSYEALESRLSRNIYATDGMKDLSGPVLKLDSLSQEDMFLLLHRIRNIFAYGNKEKYLVPNKALERFMVHASETLGSDYFKTPREVVKPFVDFLSVLEQNPGADWEKILHSTKIEKPEDASEVITTDGPEDLRDLKLKK
jgi:hypothetical protein